MQEEQNTASDGMFEASPGCPFKIGSYGMELVVKLGAWGS